jgi:hypothetical protein
MCFGIQSFIMQMLMHFQQIPFPKEWMNQCKSIGHGYVNSKKRTGMWCYANYVKTTPC